MLSDLYSRSCSYTSLSNWTNWWFTYRDYDRDGICQYFHGNDSGWDNSTAFRETPDVELPELQAFLAIQTQVLSGLAAELNLVQEKQNWAEKSNAILEAMLKHCFVDGHPVARSSFDHRILANDSLLLYLPIIVADRLPENIRKNSISTLKSDKFLTEFGLATEAPASKYYEADGYWRGPIWAPSTLLIIDGLVRCKEVDFARQLAEKFIHLAEKSGFAENYDALTGAGLRDRAYTWTSSTYLILKSSLEKL